MESALIITYIFSTFQALHFIRHRAIFSEATLAMSEFTSTISFYFKISIFIFHMPSVATSLSDLENFFKDNVILDTDTTWTKLRQEFEKVTARNTKIGIGWYSFTVFSYTIFPYIATLMRFVFGKVSPIEEFSLGIHVE